jgi:hypothetical protein
MTNEIIKYLLGFFFGGPTNIFPRGFIILLFFAFILEGKWDAIPLVILLFMHIRLVDLVVCTLSTFSDKKQIEIFNKFIKF